MAKFSWTADPAEARPDRSRARTCPAEARYDSARAGTCPAEARLESSREGGFSLIETLVATAILAVALVSLAQLFAVSTRANSNARATSYAAILAEQKMEQLRGLTYGFDNLGLPVTDTTTDVTTVPETLIGGQGLSPSPSTSLKANTNGYCDFVDGAGNVLGGGTAPPPTTAYIRRWSIEPLPTNPNNTIVLQVLVTRLRNRGTADQTSDVQRLPDEARIISVKTRKAT